MRIYMRTFLLSLSLFGWACGDNATGNGGGTEPPQSPDAGIYGSFAGKFARYARGEKFTGTAVSEWCDTVWRNDRVYRQIVLWTDEEVVNGLTFRALPLRDGSASIGAENIRLRWVDYVAGDAKALTCGEQSSRTTVYIGDALSEKAAVRLTSNDPLKMWVTVDVPQTTLPGVYTGAIEAMLEGEVAQKFDVKLVVTGHTLPNPEDWRFHLDIWQFPYQLPDLCAASGTRIQMFSPAYFQLMEPFYELLADAGQAAATTYIKDGAFGRGQTMIDWTLNTDGSWRFDYTNFDRFVEFMSDLGIDRQINCFSLAGWSDHIGYTDASDGTYKYKDLPVASEEFATVWSAFLDDFRTHLTRKGWMDKTVLYMDEARQDEMARIIDVIRSNGSDWKIGLAGSETDMSVERELYDYSTIIGYNRKSTQHARATFYTSCSQSRPNNYVTAQTSPAEMAWMAWHAAAKGLNGYLRWAFDYWTQNDPLNVQDGSNSAGDFNMIYRTGNGPESRPVSSIRFELLRDGIQDFEKMRILGIDRFRSILTDFADPSAPNAERNVLRAQSFLKKASLE